MGDVEKAIEKIPDTVRALVIVQLHSGARAGELIRLKVSDVDRSNPDAWIFQPSLHKGTWKGRDAQFTSAQDPAKLWPRYS
jgi:integrase